MVSKRGRVLRFIVGTGLLGGAAACGEQGPEVNEPAPEEPEPVDTPNEMPEPEVVPEPEPEPPRPNLVGPRGAEEPDPSLDVAQPTMTNIMPSRESD